MAIFLIKVPAGTVIGQNTTIWLDSDRDFRTGYKIFQPAEGFAGIGGAEYQINLDAAGNASLYTSTGPSTLSSTVTPLTSIVDETRQTWAVTVPAALLGNPTQPMHVYEDVNDAVFLPGDFNTSHYTIGPSQTLPTRTDLSKKVGIVYSETSAKAYFSETAYAQLCMSVQDEAMMAGIPFDLLTEADLKNINRLANYDTLIFPSFRNVNRVDLAQMQTTLTDAVPGAPETLPTAKEISQYFDYISGGYSGVGAGYPSAFGFLAPDQSQVYLAPNLYFDFTLIQYGIPQVQPDGTIVPVPLTSNEAQAVWLNQLDELTHHANKPIVLMPWHDYGPTNWANAGYTPAMFTAMIQQAYTRGAEFVTLDEASDCIKTFEQSQLCVETVGNTITATVNAADVGQFGLDVRGNSPIQSVTNWYAYDVDTVFLPRNGGTFTINLGNTVENVTHITSLPMRADFLSLSGDGKNLNFSFIGSGGIVIDLQNPTSSFVGVQGADRSVQTGETLTLSFDSEGQHSVSWQPGKLHLCSHYRELARGDRDLSSSDP